MYDWNNSYLLPLDLVPSPNRDNANTWLIAVAGLLFLLVLRRLTRPDPLHDIPGPWIAKYTSLLLAYYTRTGKRFLFIDQLHKVCVQQLISVYNLSFLHQKYGPFVRITPNQVSCADPSAPSIIYAQGSLSLPKTAFYKSFYVDGTPSLFSTQDRAGHAQKRRVLAHPFSQSSVKQFEGWIRKSLRKMIQGLDQHAASQLTSIGRRHSGLSVGAETAGRAGGSVKDSPFFVDLLMWLNYMTFDVISDLAFGEPLGMLDRASDVLGPSKDEQMGVAAMIDYRGRTAAYLGLFPYILPGAWLAPLVKWIPDHFVQRGLTGTDVRFTFSFNLALDSDFLTCDWGIDTFTYCSSLRPKTVASRRRGPSWRFVRPPHGHHGQGRRRWRRDCRGRYYHRSHATTVSFPNPDLFYHIVY